MRLIVQRQHAAGCALAIGVLSAGLIGVLGSGTRADYAAECAAPTRTIAADNSETMNLAAGDVLLFAAGTFTGGFNSVAHGAVVCVAGGAVVNPAFVNNGAGRFLVEGTVTFPALASAAGAELENSGTVSFLNGLTTNGPVYVLNLPDGVITVGQSFPLGSGAQVTNEGTITVNGSVAMNDGSTVDSSGTLTITGDLILGGQLTNTGTATVGGQLTVNGPGLVRNDCRMSAASLMNNGDTTNSGVLDLGGGNVTNNGTLSQNTTGVLLGGGFTDDGTASGFGSYRFTGSTSVQGSFTGNAATTPITVQDTTPTAGQIFDVQSGTVTNTVAGTVPVPDAGYLPPGCDRIPPMSTDIAASKTGPATAAAGGTVIYTVTLANDGPADAADVVLTDLLPVALTSVSAVPPGAIAGGAITWNVGTVAAGATQTFTVTGVAPASGTLTDIVSATTSTPDADESNNNGSLASARVDTVVQPTPPNNPPVVPDFTETTVVDVEVTIVVPFSDPDVGQVVRLTGGTTPTNGVMQIVPSGLVVYVPNPDFTGIDTFTVTGCDNGTPVLCDTGTITVTVYPVARPDRAVTDTETPVTIPVGRNDNGLTTPPQIITPPAHGTAVLTPNGSVVYTPDPAFLGTDTFDYRICSPTAPAVCATTTATIEVRQPLEPPVLGDVDLVTGIGVPVSSSVPVMDPGGLPVAVSLDVAPQHGTVVIGADGSFTYTPDPGFAGVDSFTALGCNTAFLCDCGTVTITVAATPASPQPTDPPTNPPAGHLPMTSSPTPRRWSVIGAMLVILGLGLLGAARTVWTIKKC